MKVLHVINRLSRTGGGPSRSCQGLVAALNAAGVDAALLSLAKGDSPWIGGVERFFNGDAFENALRDFKPNIVHLHELWHPGLHHCAVVCRRMGLPYIFAPRGTLEPWSLRHKWLKKRIARLLYQDRDLRGAAALHATAKSEAEQFVKLGFRNPIVVSPNGVNVPGALIQRSLGATERRVLFVSRMHPKKGVLELIEAWGRVFPVKAHDVRDSGKWICELVYTVHDNSEREYETKVRASVHELGLDGRIIFTGALDDNDKWQAYSRADLFALPTYSENFGIVVAEALWAGVPVITTKGTPWGELESHKCGWWVDIGVEPLAAALKSAMSLNDDERRDMGERGRRLVEEKYSWPGVAAQMMKGYEAVISG